MWIEVWNRLASCFVFPHVVSGPGSGFAVCPFRGFCVERLKNLMCVRLFVRPHLFSTLSEPTFASFKAILHFWCPKRDPFCAIRTKLTSICNIALKEAKVCQNEALYTKAPKGATLPCRCNLVSMDIPSSPYGGHKQH